MIKMNKKALTVLILALVLIFSGCLGKGDKAAGAYPGVLITNFRSDFAEVESEETTMVALDFDNRGGYMAKNVEGILLRKGAFTAPGTTDYDGTTEIINIESPLDNVYSGDEFYWNLKAPRVAQDRMEEVQARLSYNYKTEAYATLHFVPQSIIREQGAEAFSLSQFSSNSPVAITIEATHPIIIREADVTKYKAGLGGKTVRINLIFTDTGAGRVYSATDKDDAFFGALGASAQCTKPEDCIDSVSIEITGGDCDVKSIQNIFKEYNEFTELQPLQGIKLIQGSQGRYAISEEFEVENPNAATSCQLHVTANYRYQIDSSVLPIKIKALD